MRLVKRRFSMMAVSFATVVTCLGLAATACVPDERPGEDLPAVTVSVPASATGALQPRARVARALSRLPARPLDHSLDGPFSDDFERKELGRNYRRTSRVWRIEDGQLCARDARNHPVWLKLRLPINVRIEFDATSHSPDGDLKFELFGDGHSFARHASYTDASGYVLIFGGWKNTLHVFARLDEHGDDRLQTATRSGASNSAQKPVVPGRRYRFKVERTDGKMVRWWVDGNELYSFSDPAPLSGSGHEYFGFNDWAAPVCFDNLSVVPLEDR